MAPQVFNDFVALVCAHPVISGAVLVLFTPPFFPIVKYFSPLLISTALFMLALFTMGPKQATQDDDDEDSALRRDGDGEKVSKRMKPDGSWKDWVKSIEESSLSWMSSPRSNSKHILKSNENWKHMNDDNVSILQDATWVTKGPDYTEPEFGEQAAGETSTFMTPSQLFKVDSDLQTAAERAIYNNIDLGEDAPELEDVVEPVADPVAEPVAEPDESLREPVAEPVRAVAHQPLEALEIPRIAVTEIDSPATDLDDDESPGIDNSKRLMFANLKKGSLNASSGLSDADTPVAATLSLSGKLKQLENLGGFLDDAEVTDQEAALLKPTTADEVDDVKDQIQSFVTEENHRAPAKPDEKPRPETSKETVSSDSANVVLSDSDHAEMEKKGEIKGEKKGEINGEKKGEINGEKKGEINGEKKGEISE